MQDELTLHPALPLICLFPVQEPKILIHARHREESEDKTQECQEREYPRIELLLLLQPIPSTIAKVD